MKENIVDLNTGGACNGSMTKAIRITQNILHPGE
jgi:hypothetical protein